MARTPSTMMALGTKMPTFSLPDIHNTIVSNAGNTKRGTLVMFISNHCPFVIHLKPQLAEVCKGYIESIDIYAIMSNDVENYPDDSPQKMKEDAKRYGYVFPYLYDATQEVAKAYQAACTPDFFLFDETGQLYYRGQFDESRPGNGVSVTGQALIEAIELMLRQEPAPAAQKPSLGCNIKWISGNEPDYFG